MTHICLAASLGRIPLICDRRRSSHLGTLQFSIKSSWLAQIVLPFYLTQQNSRMDSALILVIELPHMVWWAFASMQMIVGMCFWLAVVIIFWTSLQGDGTCSKMWTKMASSLAPMPRYLHHCIQIGWKYLIAF